MGKGKANRASSSKESVDWEIGLLGAEWEANAVVRSRARASGCMTKWMSPKTKGVASTSAMHLNADLLLGVARLWCPCLTYAKSPPIPLLRAEARVCKQLIGKSVVMAIFRNVPLKLRAEFWVLVSLTPLTNIVGDGIPEDNGS